MTPLLVEKLPETERECARVSGIEVLTWSFFHLGVKLYILGVSKDKIVSSVDTRTSQFRALGNRVRPKYPRTQFAL